MLEGVGVGGLDGKGGFPGCGKCSRQRTRGVLYKFKFSPVAPGSGKWEVGSPISRADPIE